MKYSKKVGTTVQVKFARKSGTLNTLEGPVQYSKGDAIAHGVENEQWPIPRLRFLRTYEPVPPTLEGQDGQYASKLEAVYAVQASAEQIVTLGDGINSLRAKSGDWIITDAYGNSWVVADQIFKKTYERVGE